MSSLPSSLTTPLPLWDDASDTVRLTYHPPDLLPQQSSSSLSLQQPVTQSLAKLEGLWDPHESHHRLSGASVLAVNVHFVCYAVKNGLIRVLQYHHTAASAATGAGLRTLLRAHSGQTVTDLQFFQDGNVLASASHSETTSKVVIWRLHLPESPASTAHHSYHSSSSPQSSHEIRAEIMLEISTPHWEMNRIVWHPFNANLFWMLYSTTTTTTQAATLVESTRIHTNTSAEGHAVAVFATPQLLLDGALCILNDDQNGNNSTSSTLCDLTWNRHDPRHVLTVHDGGGGVNHSSRIVIWDLQHTVNRYVVSEVEGRSTRNSHYCTVPTILHQVNTAAAAPTLRCLFLPYNSHNHTGIVAPSFVTGSHRNRTLTVWSASTAQQPPQPGQQITIATTNDSSADEAFLWSVCHGPVVSSPKSSPASSPPTACFLVACSTTQGRLYAFHCAPAVASSSSTFQWRGCDFVVAFRTTYPTYSVQTRTEPAEDNDGMIMWTEEDDDTFVAGRPSFDMKLFAYQSGAVQSLTVTPPMVQPPPPSSMNHSAAVTVERSTVHSTGAAVGAGSVVSEVEEEEEEAFEEYDVSDNEDDDNDEETYEDAPDPSALPSPNGIVLDKTPSTPSHNPFDNWLGAVSAQSTATPTPLKQPVALPVPPVPITSNNVTASHPSSTTTARSVPGTAAAAVGGSGSSTFLSPMQMLFPKTDSADTTNSSAITLANPPIFAAAVAATKSTATSSGASTPVVNNTHAQQQQQQQQDTSSGMVADQIRRAVRDELRTHVVPVLRQTLTESLAEAAATQANNHKPPAVDEHQQQKLLTAALQPLQQSVEQLVRRQNNSSSNNVAAIDLLQSQVATAMDRSIPEPLRASFAECVQTVLLPTLESVTGQVLHQVSEHLERHQQDAVTQFRQKIQLEQEERDMKFDAMSHQLSTMTTLVAELTKEVQSLRQAVVVLASSATLASNPSPESDRRGPASPPVRPPPDPAQALRQTIGQLLQEKRYDDAFTKAVSSGTVEMTVFCCQNANLQEVLGGSQPGLSQPILLCLMQQLGAVLIVPPNANAVSASDSLTDATLTLLDWLQEIALSINPADPSIQRHVPNVLQQVAHNIQQRMDAPDLAPSLRRPLQRMLQVVRGVQLG